MEVLRALCPASLRFLELMWQLRNSLHAAPAWQCERLADQCDLASLFDLLHWPYSAGAVTPHLARLTWKQPEKSSSTKTGPHTSLLQAARATLPLGCYFDPPTIQQEVASQLAPQHHAEDDMDQLSPAMNLRVENDITHNRLPEPEPPPVPVVRRNPSRIARPACKDVTEYPLLSMTEMLPGRIPDKEAEALIAQGGPNLIRHPLDHPHMWIRPSYHCPGGGYSIIFRLDSNLPRGYLLGIYCGMTNDVLGLSYAEAEQAWSSSDYVMGFPGAGYIVDGDLTSGPTRANEGFHITNSFFLFNPSQRWVEFRLKGCGQKGYFEGLVNYTEPNKPSPYWTSQRVSLLPPATRAHCRAFYSSERRYTVPKAKSQSTGNQTTDKKKKKKKKTSTDAQVISRPLLDLLPQMTSYHISHNIPHIIEFSLKTLFRNLHVSFVCMYLSLYHIYISTI